VIQNSSSVGQQFLANLQLLQQQMAQTQEQVSSGYQINRPSDDPGELGDVLELESNLGQVTQVSSNLTSVSGEVNTAESALENATQLLEQAGTLASEGASVSISATQQTALSQQVSGILSELVSAANTNYEGQYVFSGDETSSPPYQLDSSSTTGVDQLVTAPAPRLIQDATGVTFGVSLTAQQIFDSQDSSGNPDANNIFLAVNSLATALASNDQAGITTAVTSIQNAQSYLSQQLQFYGGVQDQITNATDVAQKFQLQDQTSLSQVRDTNMAAASVALTQEQTTDQAAIQAEAAMPHTSLFDYINSPTS
jgi:flagellar hook-associated protein 3 FlgL